MIDLVTKHIHFPQLNFIQADPIRSPARAQDLILRHRQKDYKADQLEKEYPDLEMEEGYLYAYGFMDKGIRDLLYPLSVENLTSLDHEVWEFIKTQGIVSSKDLEKQFGVESIKNAWGGSSRATKHSLERLHDHGLARVAKRENGIRLYQAIETPTQTKSLLERKEELVLEVVRVLSPVVNKTLNGALNYIRYFLGETNSVVKKLIKDGRLLSSVVDGITYIQIADQPAIEEEHRGVKFLTPFDPLVWDRIRFEHIWGWQYRFEAYVPKAKRVRGYYAMPLLWNEKVIGWANLSIINNDLQVELGFVDKKPNDEEFKKDLDLEIDAFKEFLMV